MGCGHKKPQPLSEHHRQSLGTIGVASGRFKPGYSLQKRTSETSTEALKGAGAGAAAWAVNTPDAVFSTTDPYLGCLSGLVWLAVLPFSLIGGCIGGTKGAEPAEKLDEEGEAVLIKALDETNIQEEMRDNLYRLTEAWTEDTLVKLREQGPSAPDEKPDYSTMAGEGVDTILEVAVLRVGLVGSAKTHPMLEFLMITRVRLIRTLDGELIYSATEIHKGNSGTYSYWVQNDAQPFKTELSQMYGHVSQSMTSLLFPSPTEKIVVDDQKEEEKLAYIPDSKSIVAVSLRTEPKQILDTYIRTMLPRYDFYEATWNPQGSFRNDFVDNGDGTITDRSTGLMWQKSGSSRMKSREGARAYISEVNGFAGHWDWRLPTIDELASLLERDKKDGLHIDPVFDPKQKRCWSSDVNSFQTNVGYDEMWIVSFSNGQVTAASIPDGGQDAHRRYDRNYVKAVRSIE